MGEAEAENEPGENYEMSDASEEDYEILFHSEPESGVDSVQEYQDEHGEEDDDSVESPQEREVFMKKSRTQRRNQRRRDQAKNQAKIKRDQAYTPAHRG